MNRSRRQYRLLLIAVVLPALVLAVRFLRQEKELTQQGAATERSAAVDQMRRELSAQLEKITLEEFNRRSRELKSPSSVGRIKGPDLEFPSRFRITAPYVGNAGRSQLRGNQLTDFSLRHYLTAVSLARG